MKSRKLIGVYIGLLIIAVATMIMLWRLKAMSKAEVLPRDYPEIKEEGVLRLVTEYNQSGYYVAGDTIEGFQYELSQAIAQLSGLEVQTLLEMSLAESFDMLEDNKCDIVARNIPITSEIKEKYLFTEPIILDKQVLIQRTEKANNGLKPIRNQLDLAGKIALDRVAVRQVLDLVPVAGRHDILLQRIIQVAADCQAVDHELVLIHKHGDNGIHHHLVRRGKNPPSSQIVGRNHILRP